MSHTDIFGKKRREKEEKQGSTIDTIEEKIKQSNKSAFDELLKNKMKGK